MSKKQLLKDNLIMFIGGNIANALNYLLNIVLLRVDNVLFNLYTAYTSVALLLLIPSLVSMRVFTVFGNPLIENIRRFYLRNKNKVLLGIIFFAILLIPINLWLTHITIDGTFATSSLLIILGITGFIASIFRGIRQQEEDYKIAVLSLNIEAIGRVVLGYLFAVVFEMGISGILLGHVLGLVGSLIVCFDRKQVKEELEHNNEIRLKNIFFNTFLMTAGLEFFSNYDIIFANNIFTREIENKSLTGAEHDLVVESQTEFNTLQFFRKIIFFGIFTVSSIILSIGGKDKHSKKFMFFLTLITGFTIGLGLGGTFYLLKDLILGILNQHINLIPETNQIVFLVATTLMSTSYLICNWLFTVKKKLFIYLPIIASVIQVITFFIFGQDLFSLLDAFFISSCIFFLLTFICGASEAFTNNRESSYEANIIHEAA